MIVQPPTECIVLLTFTPWSACQDGKRCVASILPKPGPFPGHPPQSGCRSACRAINDLRVLKTRDLEKR